MRELWCCAACWTGFHEMAASRSVVDFVNLVFGWEARDEGRTYVPLDRVVILRADLPRRYGGGNGAGLQQRLTLCDWCGRERFPLH